MTKIAQSLLVVLLFAAVSLAQQNAPARAKAYETAPDISYESVPNFLKMPPNTYLGEGIGVARNSKGHGDDDRTVEFRQSIDLKQRLTEKGVKVDELVLPDDVHDSLLWRNWTSSISAMAQFFERNLKAKK